MCKTDGREQNQVLTDRPAFAMCVLQSHKCLRKMHSECVRLPGVSGSNWDNKDYSKAPGTLRLFLEGSRFTQKVETVMVNKKIREGGLDYSTI